MFEGVDARQAGRLDMNPQVAFSPISLSYIAALRGLKPHKIREKFVYAELNTRQPEALLCLAASNPEGSFYGVLSDASTADAAREMASSRGVSNIAFMQGTPSSLLANPSALPKLHYLCCDESANTLAASERKAFYELAGNLMLPNGLVSYTYRAYDREDGHLRFLVREFAPEMNAEQAKGFLREIKKLGSIFLSSHPDVLDGLNKAIAKDLPDEFFSDYDSGVSASRSFDTLVGLGPRGFAYVGDSAITSNYIDMVVPAEAQPIVLSCRDNYLYEPIKDFVLDRMVRSDVWCFKPTVISNPVELFGAFCYGIPLARTDVPEEVKTLNKTVELKSVLYKKLIDLMTTLPLSIGDFLSHPDGAGYNASEVLEAIQVMVACGVARPMRGGQTTNTSSVAQPRLVGTFNRYLDKLPVMDTDMWLASPVLGGAVTVSAREALVMQALDRAGLANSVSALMPELERLAKNPIVASHVMNTTEPTPEFAKGMVVDVVEKSIIQWYAYGLLEAA